MSKRPKFLTLEDAAAAFGRRGGQAKTKRKAEASRLNGQKGGWPKGKRRKWKETVSTSTGDVVTIGRDWFRAGGKVEADGVVATRMIPMSPREIAAHKKANARPRKAKKGKR